MIELNSLQNRERRYMGDDGADYNVIVFPGERIRIFGVSRLGEAFDITYKIGDLARCNRGQLARNRGPVIKITEKTVTVQNGPNPVWDNGTKRIDFYRFAAANALGEKINSVGKW